MATAAPPAAAPTGPHPGPYAPSGGVAPTRPVISTAPPGAAGAWRPSALPASARGAAASAIWDLDGPGVEAWIRQAKGALFPRRPAPRVLATPEAGEEERDEVLARAELQRLQKRDEEEYARSVAAANRLLANLRLALRSAETKLPAASQPAPKRAKTESGTASAVSSVDDTYKILDASFARGKDVDHGTAGAILSRLSPGGLINGLSGVAGGVVDPSNGRVLPTPDGTPGAEDVLLPTAENLTLAQLRVRSKALHRAVLARVEMDMLNATPGRIVEMLCPETSLLEVNAIRSRILRKINSSATAQAMEGGEDLPVAARTGVHDLEKWQKCKVCGNNDQSSFVMDRKNGDLICTQCGTISQESLMHEGSQFRKFEGEEDRNHHGDAPNPLYSVAHNLSTTLGGMGFQTGAGIGGFGSQRKQGLENVIRNAHAYTELNISQFGKSEKKTRIGYKDRQKKDAFVQMTHVGDALGLHEAVVQRAKELFAGFRDDRELVQQFKGVLAACLIEAFDKLSQDGRQLLKMRTGEDEDDKSASGAGGPDPVASSKKVQEAELAGNKRASRRSELHSATLAGKGGIFIGTPTKPKDGAAGGGSGSPPSSAAAMSAVERKPVPTWDMDDCRSWFLEASRSIARQWSEARRTGERVGAAAKIDGPIPEGSLDELEGRLVERTFALCEMLEEEMKKGGGGKGAGAQVRKKVVTPRVRDMGSLGIKWQHAHERGSGGKGGVGNNAATVAAQKAKMKQLGLKRLANNRTAGQILILKTSKVLGEVVKDPVAGDAFHRELKSLLQRLAAVKKKELRDEAAQQRFHQMQRKPWLQARAEQKN